MIKRLALALVTACLGYASAFAQSILADRDFLILAPAQHAPSPSSAFGYTVPDNSPDLPDFLKKEYPFIRHFKRIPVELFPSWEQPSVTRAWAFDDLFLVERSYEDAEKGKGTVVLTWAHGSFIPVSGKINLDIVDSKQKTFDKESGMLLTTQWWAKDRQGDLSLYTQKAGERTVFITPLPLTSHESARLRARDISPSSVPRTRAISSPVKNPPVQIILPPDVKWHV